jgi:hypothetical protein
MIQALVLPEDFTHTISGRSNGFQSRQGYTRRDIANVVEFRSGQLIEHVEVLAATIEAQNY